MEQAHEQPSVSADNSKLPLAEESLNKALEKEVPTYELPAEAFLNPENIDHISELNPENKIEGFSVSTQYQNMIGDIVMDKVLRPHMTDAEINAVAAAMVAEYEAPVMEEIAQEENQFMEQTTAENQKEVVASDEQKLSPLSRAIELMSGWLSKHPAWTKTAMGAVVASELAGCATGGGYYGGYTAQQMISTSAYGIQQGMQTEAYGRQQQRQTEAYGSQQANSQARYAVSQIQSLYQQSMMAEDSYYRQSIAQPLSPERRAEVESRHSASVEGIKARYQQQMSGVQGTYNNTIEQTRIQSENIRMNTAMQRQNIQMNTHVQITNQIIQGLIQGMMHR